METAIYGAGRNGKTILSGLLESGHAIDYLIDDQMAGQQFGKIPIISCADSVTRPATVYVSVVPQRDGVSNRSRHDDVCQELGSLQHKVVDFEHTLRSGKHVLAKYFNQSHLWMSADTERMVDHGGLDQFSELLTDEKSRMLLEKIVALRATRDMKHYVSPDDSIEYFPDDIPILDSCSSVQFADCGSFTGDTVVDILQYAGKPVDHVTCFEPDVVNLQTLTNTIRKLRKSQQLSGAHIYPCGVWSTNTTAQFASGNGSSSALVNGIDESVTVPLVALDTVLAGCTPNYIKMDIEGAEKQALLGARSIIETSAPALAICLYHKPSDLWELPLLIHEIQPDYKMGLRVHGHLGLSTILYCYH